MSRRTLIRARRVYADPRMSPPTVATGLLYEGGRVIAVGDADALGGADTRVVDLGTAVVVPGLQDAHAHLFSLGKALTTIDLTGTRSLAEALERIRAAPPSVRQGDAWVGRGWNQALWTDAQGRFPDRHALDGVKPGEAVVLSRIDGHATWASTEALRRAGITRFTADPPGGQIERDATGEPTGILIDNAMPLVERALPPLSRAERRTRVKTALDLCASAGLTCVHDAGMDLETFEVLQQLERDGELKLRVYVMADGQTEDRHAYLERGFVKTDRIDLRSVKLLSDGALGSRGAALHADYCDRCGHRGLLLLPPGELEARARGFMERQFQVNIHAIGDRANTLVLDVLERTSAQTGTRSLRHRVEHAQILRAEDVPRFARGGFIASMQPIHATSDMWMAEARLGEPRLTYAYAWRTLKESGARLAFGSDFPVEDPRPLLGLHAARTRQDARGEPPGGWKAQERLSGLEALEGFTSGAAWASHAENRRGTLAPGMDADFTVLPMDPVDDPAEQLLTAQPLATVVAGRAVFTAPGVMTPE